MEHKMTEGVDYCFIYPKDDTQTVHIKLLDGPYKNTVFKYGKCKFEERHGDVHLIFAFDVIESEIKAKKLEKDTEFKNYIGDFLVHLMSNNMEQEIIDETRTDDIKVPDL
jgi:hypothetical protein